MIPIRLGGFARDTGSGEDCHVERGTPHKRTHHTPLRAPACGEGAKWFNGLAMEVAL